MVSPFFWGRLEGAGTFSCSPLVSLFKGDAEGRGIGAGGGRTKNQIVEKQPFRCPLKHANL